MTHLSPQELQALLVACITAAFSGIASCILAYRSGLKVEAHDARSTARAREDGGTANPAVHKDDRGHV